MHGYKWLLAAGAIALADVLALGAGCGGRAGDGSAAPDSSAPESPTSPEAAVDATVEAGALPDGGAGTVTFGFSACQSKNPQVSCTYGSTQLSFAATFLSASEVCTPKTAGACQYSLNCGIAAGPTVGAGTLTISGGPLTATVHPNQGTAGYHIYFPPDGGVLSPGQTFTASASGDVVPAWGPVSVVAAPPATLISPMDGATVASTQDLPVTWSGGQPGARFRVSLSATIGFGQFVECEWDATLGHGVIPAVALATALPNTTASLTQSQVTGTSLDAGGYAVRVEAVQGVELGLNIH
jgi:hypothetical protein